MDHFNALQVAPDAPLFEVLKIIDSGASQIALVVDDQERLLGTLTDGDIRRGLLHGATLQDRAEGLMNRSFRFSRVGEDRSLILQMMRSEKLRQIPILDQSGRLVDLFLLQDFLSCSNLPNPVVIMAGGKGSRLHPHTAKCPQANAVGEWYAYSRNSSCTVYFIWI